MRLERQAEGRGLLPLVSLPTSGPTTCLLPLSPFGALAPPPPLVAEFVSDHCLHKGFCCCVKLGKVGFNSFWVSEGEKTWAAPAGCWVPNTHIISFPLRRRVVLTKQDRWACLRWTSRQKKSLPYLNSPLIHKLIWMNLTGQHVFYHLK